MDNRVVKNFIYNIAYKILVIISPLVTTPYISRVLHSDGVGIYSYSYSIAYAFSLFAALGFSTYGQREIAYVQDNKYKRSIIFWEIILLRLYITIPVITLYLYVSFLYKTNTLYLICQSFIVVAVLFDIAWFYQGIEDFKTVVLRNLIVKFSTVVFIFIFVKTEQDVWLYILINSLSILLSNLFYIFSLRKNILKININKLQPLRHFKGAIQFFIPLIAVEIYSHLDKIMIGALTNNIIENGYYEQARKIIQLLVSVVISINTVLLPRISNLFKNNKHEQIVDYYQKSVEIMMIIMCPICLGLICVADNFTIVFFGSGYDKVAVLLKISSLIIPFMCIGNFVGMQYLTPTGQQNRMTFAYVIAAISNIILNFILIPQLLSIGALLASIIAELISCFIQVLLLYKSRYWLNITIIIKNKLIASVIMAISLMIFNNLFQLKPIVIVSFDIILGALVYTSILLLIRDRASLEFVKFLVNRSRKQTKGEI